MKRNLPVSGLIRRSAKWALALIFFCSTATAADLIVIANKNVPLEQVDRTELRAIYALRKRLWSDGTPVETYTLPGGSPLQQTFAKQVLHLYPYQLKLLWNRAVFSGIGRAPTEVDNEAEMLKAIATTAGAIGYISPRDELPEGVKILRGAKQ